MRQRLHQDAVKRFFTQDFGAAVHTGVWSRHHVNPLWLRCPSCRRVTDATAGGASTGLGLRGQGVGEGRGS
jgi:hypothetical protein